MEDKLTGVVLKNTPLTDSKSLITFLSAERGRKLVTCHGSRKLTARSMPATQPFCYCELIVSEKNGRLTLKESCLLESFFDLRCDLLDCALGSYMLELCDHCANEEQPEGELLSLLLNSLYSLCRAGHDRRKIKAAFELRLLGIEGSGPLFAACACCGKTLSGECFFSPAEGGAVCSSCKTSGDAAGPFYALDEGAKRAAEYILTCPPKRVFSFKTGEKSMKNLERIAREAVVYTFERYFESLKFYEQQIRNDQDETS